MMKKLLLGLGAIAALAAIFVVMGTSDPGIPADKVPDRIEKPSAIVVTSDSLTTGGDLLEPTPYKPSEIDAQINKIRRLSE